MARVLFTLNGLSALADIISHILYIFNPKHFRKSTLLRIYVRFLKFIFHLEIDGGGNLNTPFLKWLVQCGFLIRTNFKTNICTCLSL